MLFHIIHILILTLDPNPNPELKKKKKKKNIFVHETSVRHVRLVFGRGKKRGVVRHLFDCW